MLKFIKNGRIIWKGCDNMPNVAGHMAVAKKVSELLKIDSDDFYRGNLIPDLYKDKVKSHYKIQGKKFLIPDIEKIEKEIDLTNLTDLGILSHLLLDKYYFDEFLLDLDPKEFSNNKIYDEYDIINKDIVNYFKLDTKRIIKAFSDIKIKDIEKIKLEKNISYLQLEVDGKTKLLNKDNFIIFLNDSSLRIVKEIKKLKNNIDNN